MHIHAYYCLGTPNSYQENSLLPVTQTTCDKYDTNRLILTSHLWPFMWRFSTLMSAVSVTNATNARKTAVLPLTGKSSSSTHGVCSSVLSVVSSFLAPLFPVKNKIIQYYCLKCVALNGRFGYCTCTFNQEQIGGVWMTLSCPD